MQKDRFDEAVEMLVCLQAIAKRKQEGSVVKAAWLDPYGHPQGILFRLACPGPRLRFTPFGECGCLTTIRSRDDGQGNAPVAYTPELTEAIRNDDRLPRSIGCVEYLEGEELRRALTPFAEWQRKLERMFTQPRIGEGCTGAK